ncbi:MAG TPA: polysaccharide deacetylase family protein [Coleofasciculaceae cyanobacterium]
MADRHLFVGQRSLSLAVVAAAVSFITGCSLPVAQSANPVAITSQTLPLRQQNSDSQPLKVQALVSQQTLVYKQVLAKWVQEETVQQLNSPIPAKFQGKTLRDVKFNKDNPALTQKGAKPIALTFDDGPWPNSTSQVLNILKKNNVKATFFVVGRQVKQYPQLTKRLVAEGHAIGNHSWSHQYHRYSPSAAAHELNSTTDLVHKITGVKTSLFRPPGGILNNGLATYAQQKKYAVIMWSADSLDWRYRGTSALINSVLREAQPGAIVLLHDGGGNRSKTVQALPQLIAQLKKRGYKFVTVPELLEMQAPKKEQVVVKKG